MPRVVVVDYDPAWPLEFAALRQRIWPAVQDVALRIEHVGSTSVPNLAAKSILDISIVVATRHEVRAATERLEAIGYVHRGNLGIEDRDAFDHPADRRRHNLYLCPDGTIGIVNHLAVRDYLRSDAAAAARYGALKKQLATQYPDDVDRYVRGKTDFLIDILRRAGVSAEQIAAIERDNR